MRIVAICLVIFSFGAIANEPACFSKEEASVLKSTFYTLTGPSLLELAATEDVKDNINEFEGVKYLDKIIIHSTEIDFDAGPVGDYVSSTRTVGGGPEAGCVWNVSFLSPKKIRKMCDDDGAAGYYFDFTKVNGKVKLTNAMEMEETLDDGSFACRAYNDYING